VSFHEVRFPESISYSFSGGPSFRTDVTVLQSGYEQRQSDWEDARRSYTAELVGYTEAQMGIVTAFFLARKGRAYGFRFKDWGDYQGSGERIGTGDGSTTTFQLVKNYKNQSYAAGSATNFTLSISAVDQANKQFTISGDHSDLFASGHWIEVTGSTGNDGWYKVSAVTTSGGNTVMAVDESIPDATADGSVIPYVTRTITKPVHGGVPPGTSDTVVIYLDGVQQGSGWSVDATTGIVTFSSAPAAGKRITADFEFDVPVRFDTDLQNISQAGPGLRSWGSISLIEVRI